MVIGNSSTRTFVAIGELEAQLQDQLAFLERSCAAFDDGYTDEFKRLAVTLRVLVHDTPKSHSLLRQLGMKGGNFAAYSKPIDGRNLLTDWSLGIMSIGSEGVALLPALDCRGIAPRLLQFDDWWSELVYRDPQAGITLDRKTIVLAVANKDGGAHVDPEIDDRYAHLVNEGTGWIAQTPHGVVAIEDLEKICLRHIAFEVLKSIQPAFAKLLGNRGCACGSGRKHRYCCGKTQVKHQDFLRRSI